MSNHFDTYQFGGGGMYPVHADYIGNGEFTTTGIDYADYTRMTTQTHKLAAGRHGAAPEWVFNNTKLRAVIVGCVEARALNGHETYDRTGTHAERLVRAQQKLAQAKPNLEARIDELCKQYMAAKRAGDTALTKHFAQKVEETDTTLRLLEDPARYYIGAAYHYWRAGLNSVATGEQLGIKPPHVRQILWRMGKVAGQLGYGPQKTTQHRPGTKRAQQAAARATQVGIEAALLTLRTRKQHPAMSAAAMQFLDKQQGLTPQHKARIAAAMRGNTNGRGRRGRKYGPMTEDAERLPLVIKMYREGARKGQIAKALGYPKDDGYRVVNRLLMKAGLR